MTMLSRLSRTKGVTALISEHAACPEGLFVCILRVSSLTLSDVTAASGPSAV